MHLASKVAFFFLFAVCTVSCLTALTNAATHLVGPEDNSVYIDQRDADINKSDKSGILTASALNENARIVIHFDLTGWSPDSISQAKLHLYHYRGGYYTGFRTINVYALTTTFSEAVATWNTPWDTPGGDYDNSIGTSADVPEAWENWVEWDVTDIVKGRWNDVAECGFLIKDPLEDDTGDGPYVLFYSHRGDSLPYLELVTGQTGVDEAGDDEIRSGFFLGQNFPNPFNGRTVLQFELPKPAQVNLAIYNLRGQKVKTLLDATRQAGGYTLEWDGTNQAGQPVASGLYVCRMRTADFYDTKRLLYLR
jgi:hypothetical protein